MACTSAQAETVAATLKKWGLTGEWSRDCAEPAGEGLAGRLRYVLRSDGSVVHLRNFGKRTSSDDILASRVTPEGWLELQVHFHDVVEGQRDRTFALEKVRSGVVRAVYNYNANGQYSVKDKKFSNGSETPLQYKCD